MSARHLLAVAVLATGCAEGLELKLAELVTTETEGGLDVHLVDDGVLPGVVEDASFDVKLYDERQSWYLGTYLDTDAWGPVLLADSVLRADGTAPLFEVVVTELVWTAEEPLTLTVLPGSRDGWTARASAGGEVEVAPAACTLVVTRDTTAEQHAADLTGCLRAWADANGGPAGLALDVVGASAAADWAYAAHVTLATTRAVEAACTGPQILPPVDQSAFGTAQAEDLDLWGNVAAKADAHVVTWENTFFYGEPAPTAGGLSHRLVQGGTSGEIGRAATFPADWADRSLETLASPDGFVDACVVVAHEGAPDDVVVNYTATLEWSL